MPTISIEVTADIASKIRLMAEAGVFGLKTGQVTLNIKQGALTTVKLEQFTYAQDLSTSEVDIKILSPIV